MESTETTTARKFYYVSTGTGIRFHDLEAALDYINGTDEQIEMYAPVEVCEASADFQTLSYTTKDQYLATLDSNGVPQV